ncbi:DUF3572 domain-containing protein [Cognatishimia sp. SS12]|uniref:DUF3572 domain-containing protein n=1 Tax=Cognatishimia sp. SS12 TaxID=2979465 RepID=UPI00232B390D|nr:DUF3572 domain-containing protein [Cognatishimia sp. SS12]MDC0736690.1 DUF3572 domain-containing protein [Cognatishimia sp. SS12]
MSLNSEAAETIGLQALGWLASNEELLPVFLGASGASVSDLKSQAGDPAFLASILDFVTMDDAWVVAFCDSAGLDYAHPMAARQALPGGAQVNWT